jgi:hypothetical protein
LKKTCILKGCVSLDIVYMWLELLKLEGLGFFQVEVVKDLSQKARVLSVLFLHGFGGRATWQSILQAVLSRIAHAMLVC